MVCHFDSSIINSGFLRHTFISVGKNAQKFIETKGENFKSSKLLINLNEVETNEITDKGY